MSYNGLIGGIVNIPETGNPTVSKNGLTFYNGDSEEELVNGRRYITSYFGFLRQSYMREDGTCSFRWFKMDKMINGRQDDPFWGLYGIMPNYTNRVVGATNVVVLYEGLFDITTHNVPTRTMLGNSNTTLSYSRYVNWTIKGKDLFLPLKTQDLNSSRLAIIPTHRNDLVMLTKTNGSWNFVKLVGNDFVPELIPINNVMYDLNTRNTIKLEHTVWVNQDNYKIDIKLSNQANLKSPIQMLGGIINNNRLPVLRLRLNGEEL